MRGIRRLGREERRGEIRVRHSRRVSEKQRV